MTWRVNDQHLKHDQVLNEDWHIEYRRGPSGGTINLGRVEARLSWPHHTIHTVVGKGDSVEEARLDLVARLAAAIADDPDPFGDNPQPAEEGEEPGVLDEVDVMEDVLVPLYRANPQAVARLCEEKLDRSGALLGDVRSAAIDRSQAEVGE